MTDKSGGGEQEDGGGMKEEKEGEDRDDKEDSQDGNGEEDQQNKDKELGLQDKERTGGQQDKERDGKDASHEKDEVMKADGTADVSHQERISKRRIKIVASQELNIKCLFYFSNTKPCHRIYHKKLLLSDYIEIANIGGNTFSQRKNYQNF
jgi:hypothetical protein